MKIISLKPCFILFLFFSVGLISCSNQTEKGAVAAEVVAVAPDTSSSARFSIRDKKDQDSVIQNGESIKRYENGVIKMRGMMKDGKRDGLWKSWYENGTPWSETTFKEGVKEGPTTTWYETGKKRYEGFYKNDSETGKWMYYDEKGNVQTNKDYGTK